MRKKYIVSVIVLCILCILINPIINASAMTTDINNVDKSIEKFADEHSDTTAGMAVSIFNADEDIYSGYFGYIDKENSIEVDENSVFEWGSATKLLVWTSVMQLYEQGLIDLEADVKGYLPDNFFKNLRFDKPITMINLMNHNAGFQETVYNVFIKRDNIDNMKPLGELLSEYQPEQIFEPGTVTAYSNWGVAVAGYIVERITDKPFYEYVNENIFDPLGMDKSSLKPGFDDNEFVKEQWEKLVCYTTDVEEIPSAKCYVGMYPAGSCTSTLNDCRIFAQALMTGDSRIFKSAETYRLFLTPSSTYVYNNTEIPRNCHGMWMVPFENPVYGHGGNTAGCSSYILIDPQNDIGAVVMTNQSGETVYNEEMMELVFGKYDPTNYFGETPDRPSGIYKPGRTILKGGLKPYSLSFISFEDEDDEDEFAVEDKASGNVQAPYGDYTKSSIAVFIMETGLCILWILSILACIVMLIIKLVQKIRKKDKRPLGIWAVLSMMTELLIIAAFAFVVISALTYGTMAESFFWAFYIIFALTIITLLMIIIGTVGLIKTEMKKGTRAFNIVTLCTLVICTVNVLYWNLFAFWIT